MSIVENNIPNVVYHYCSVDTMMKIFDTKSIIGSIHTSMNDFSDCSWWFQVLIQEANIIRNSKNSQLLDDFLNHIYININDYYITSFSKSNDILSQWRSYADDGKGVCIGFYSERICKNYDIPAFNELSNKGWVEINYIEDEQRKLAVEVLTSITKSDPSNYVTTNFTRFLLACKNPAFKEEDEVRYVEVLDSRTLCNPECLGYSTLYQGNSFQYRYKPNIGIVAFRLQNVNNYESDNFKINSITFGPKCFMDKTSLKLFLNKYRVNSDVILTQSKATYR